MTASPIELFDANAWIGAWPFAARKAANVSMIARRMRLSGVARALVSPLGSVLAPSPMPGNLSLLAETPRFKQIIPVPVINPRLATWHDDLVACAADLRVKTIRIVPAYHNYSLASPKVTALLAAMKEKGLRLIVTARFEDERQQYFALRIRGVPLKHIAALCDRHKDIQILCTGLYLPEVEKLSKCKNLLADTSMTEWVDTLGRLKAKVPVDRICFGTLAPFLSMQANVAKVVRSPSPIRERRLIGSTNLERFLHP